MNTPELGSGWLSVSELWNVIMAGSGSNPNPEKDRPFTSPSPPEETSGELPHILVVEDSATDIFLIREALDGAQINARIHIVRDGNAATSFFDAADADPGS